MPVMNMFKVMFRLTTWFIVLSAFASADDQLDINFRRPPSNTRPWVYWYFMDGNMTAGGITADLEAMRDAGIGGAIFFEVDLGIPRGPVEFMSADWLKLVAHAVHEGERLGIEIAIGAGPGWSGAGGPWVRPEQSMQHLVAAESKVTGPRELDAILPRPVPRVPFFGLTTLTPEFKKAWQQYMQDEVVLAFREQAPVARIEDIDQKALYYRAPYTSVPGVSSALGQTEGKEPSSAETYVVGSEVIDLTSQLSADGRMKWSVPSGDWVIARFGRTSTGQLTRPAPLKGLGFETDKFAANAIEDHFTKYIGAILKEIGPRKTGLGGLKFLHFDSWEMSSQNWSKDFRRDFIERRKYDPLRFLPALTGRVVDSPEITERFLWDIRETGQELTIANHLRRLKELAHANGLGLSVEPYDMNPAGDLALGAVADIPTGEFWWLGFNSNYSVTEAASTSHTIGSNIVAAESFTSFSGEDWRAYPANMKALGDWAFCAGVNRFVIHRFQHQPWSDKWPGMQMGPFGVHWDRTQTWWPLVAAYHEYLARCQYMLRQGDPVADILFLASEGAPNVFTPPPSATFGTPADHREYNFDGCAPETLIARATVDQGRITFPGGASYSLMVLPVFKKMTPRLLHKIKELVDAGATIVGAPVQTSPSLSDYPRCDADVQSMADDLWPQTSASKARQVIWNEELAKSVNDGLRRQHPLEAANWIWSDKEEPDFEAPLGTRYFHYDCAVPEQIASAQCYITADSKFDLYVNGVHQGSGSYFGLASSIDLSRALHVGKNEILVKVDNVGESPKPAGLIAALAITTADGREYRVVTDRNWTVSDVPNQSGTLSHVIGPLGTGPWFKPFQLDCDHDISTYYPSYDSLVRILAANGILPEFVSNGPIRYTHRRVCGAEIYFVANRSDRRIEANCVFRVINRQPEIWYPTSGEQRRLGAFSLQAGQTEVPLVFEPNESYFVVFRDPAAGVTKSVSNFSSLKKVQPLTGPWHVSFGNDWSDPLSVDFESLQDWTQSSEPRIKYYSGLARYGTSFDGTKAKAATKSGRVFLDLGKVMNLARVRLNGFDLGVLWCAPFRIDITDKLRAGQNDLEVDVANLWINRLIGDSGLPPGQTRIWSSYNPFVPTSPLMESGLLGPVDLLKESE